MYRVDNKNKKEYRRVTTKAKYFVVLSLFLLLLLVVVGSSAWNLHLRVIGFVGDNPEITNPVTIVSGTNANNLLLKYVDYSEFTETIEYNGKIYYTCTYNGNTHTPKIKNIEDDARDFDLTKFKYEYTCLYLPNNTTKGEWVAVNSKTTITAPKESGWYKVVITYSDLESDFNYSSYIGSATLYFAIQPKEIDVSVSRSESVYGDATRINEIEQTVTAGVLCGADTVDSLNSTFSLQSRDNTLSEASEETNLYAGEYNIVGTDNSRNYAITFKPKIVEDGTYALYTITKRPITVQILDQISVYGDLPFDFANLDNLNNNKVAKISVNTLAYSDKVSDVISVSCGLTLLENEKTITSNVGEYPIVGININDNYEVTFANGSWTDSAECGTYTITKAPLNMTATSFKLTYGAEKPTYSVTYEGFKNGETKNVIVGNPSFTCTYVPNKQNGSVGTYSISPSLDEQTNYEINPIDGTLTVSKKALTITLDSKSTHYGEKAPAFTCTPTGFVYSESFTTYKSDFSLENYVTDDYTVGDSIGEYNIAWSILESELENILTNYDCTLVANKLTVNARPISVTIDDKSSVYGANPVALTATVAVTQGYTLTGNPIYGTDNPYTLTTPVTNTIGFGTYPIVGTRENSNYDITFVGTFEENKGTYTVTKKAISIVWSNTSFTYDGSSHKPVATAGGLVNGDTCEVIVSGEKTNAGSYIATAENVSNSNYILPTTNLTASFTIAPKGVTITWTNILFTYDGKYHKPTATAGGLVEGDDCTINVSGEQINANTDSNPTYTATASIVKGEVIDNNYKIIERGTQNFTIEKAPLTITAEDKTTLVGVEPPEFTVKYDGFVNGETQSVLGGELTFAAIDSSITATAGEYVDVIVPMGLTSDNYDISFVSGKLTVVNGLEKPTIGNNSFVYNGTTIEYLPDGFDPIKMAISGNSATEANTYTATVTPLNSNVWTDNTSTALTFEWTITKKGVAITWGNAEFTYSGTAQAPTATIGGVISGDDCTITVSGDQTNVGTYIATATLSGTKAYNYSLPANSICEFTIKQATTVISGNISISDWTYGGTASTPSGLSTNFGDIQYQYSSKENGTYSTTQPSNAGSYYVKGVVVGNDNYTSAESAPVAFNINKVTLSISEDTATFIYNSNPQTYSPEGFDSLTMAIENNTRINAGSQMVTVTIKDSANYKWEDGSNTPKTFTFTIDKATPFMNGDLSLSATNIYEGDIISVNNNFVFNVNETTTNVVDGETSLAIEYLNSYSNATNNSVAVTITFSPTDTNNFNEISLTFADELKVKCVAYIGTTYFGTVEKALETAVSGNIVCLIPGEKNNYSASNTVKPDRVEYTIRKNCEIKSGVTLVLPTDKTTLSTVTDSSTLNTYISSMYNATTDKTSKDYASEDNYLRCTLNIAGDVTLTNNGKLVVSGYLSAGNSNACRLGHTAYSYAQIKLGANAKVVQNNSAATTYLFGYILEQAVENGSTVEINSGTLYVPFIIDDYRGFSFSWAMTDGAIDTHGCSAFNQFELRNIDAWTTIKYGVNVSSYLNVLVSYSSQNINQVFTKEIKLIGTTTDYFLQLTDANYSYVKYKYDKNSAAKLDIYGGATLNYISLKLSASIVTVDLSTNNAYFPISYRMFVSLNKNENQTTDAVYNFTKQRLKLLPGSQVTINGGCDVTAEAIIVYSAFYDGTQGNGQNSKNAYTSVSYPLKEGAKLIINDSAKLTSNKLAGTVYKSDQAQVSYTTSTIIAKEAWNLKGSGKISPAWTISDYLEIREKLNLVTLDYLDTKIKMYVGFNTFTNYNAYLPSVNVISDNGTSSTVSEYQQVLFFDSLSQYSLDFVSNIYLVRYNANAYSKGQTVSYSASNSIICAINSVLSISNNNNGINEFNVQEVNVTCTTPTIDGKIPLFVGSTVQLAADVVDIDKAYNKKLTWVSLDTSIATVDSSGVVTGVALGKVIIQATCDGVIGTIELEVIEEIVTANIESIYITDNKGNTSQTTSGTSDFGGSTQVAYHGKYGNNQAITFTININPANAPYQSITWKLTASAAGRQYINDTAQQVNTVENVTQITVHTVSGTGGSDDKATLTCVVIDLQGKSFTATFVVNHKADVSVCLAEGTLITLADGTQKKVEDLNYDDVLLAFNHVTGQYEASPLLVNLHAQESSRLCRIIYLDFSDGTRIGIIGEHSFFDIDENKYVYIDEDTVKNHIGHRFVKVKQIDGRFVSEEVVLNEYNIVEKTMRVFSPVSGQINVVTEGLLSFTEVLTAEGPTHGVINIFEFGENLKYDEVKMQEDIDKYGLYTYDDYKAYLTYEEFISFPWAYFKVSVGKGRLTWDDILWNIQYIHNDRMEQMGMTQENQTTSGEVVNSEQNNTPQNSDTTNENPFETVALPPPTTSTSSGSGGDSDNSNDDKS